MQPLGRKPIRRNFPDNHPRPKSKYVNWWEVELGCGANKKAARQAAKKEIREYLWKKQIKEN